MIIELLLTQMKRTAVRSQAKIKIPLDVRLAQVKVEHLPPLTTRETVKTSMFSLHEAGKLQLSSPMIQRSRKKLGLLREVKAVREVSSSDSGRGIRGIDSGEGQRIVPELTVLRANTDRRTYLRQPIVKQSLVGEQAVRMFYERFRQLQRQRDRQDFQQQQQVMTAIVSLLQAHNFTPRKLTLVKLRGEEALLDLRKLALGQGLLGPLVGELLQFLDRFQQVDLSYNRIDPTLAETFISRLAKARRIDLSHNRIGKIGCERLSQLFLQNGTRIQQLNLEQNALLDNAGAALLQNLQAYTSLRKLYLSKNYLGIKFAQRLKQLLKQHDKNLNQLYLSWNQFNHKSVKAILEGVLGHAQLKVFDFSWNRIENDGVDLLAQVFKQASNLVHVDISFCELRLQSIAKLATALKGNHTLYGLHFQGNSGSVDHCGFLQRTKKEFSEYPLPIIRGVLSRIEGIRPQIRSNEFRAGTIRDVCWICQSWQEQSFSTPLTSQMQNLGKGSSRKECFIHFRHQNYSPIRLFLNTQTDTYQIQRMCPLGSLQFFFSYFSGSNRIIFLSSQYQTVQSQSPLRYFQDGKQLTASIDQLNTLDCEYDCNPLQQNYEPNIGLVPRTPEVKMRLKKGQKLAPAIKKRRVVQQKANVAFKQPGGQQEFIKDANRQNEDYVKRCIDFDVANSKIGKLIKDFTQMARFKDIMVRYYRPFKDAFYYLARNTPSFGNIYSISELDFQKFLEEQRYPSKRVTEAKIMLKLYACLAPEEGEEKVKKDSSVKLLCRPQFLEFLVRLAIEKWCFNPHKKPPKVNKQLLWQQEQKRLLKQRKAGKKQPLIKQASVKVQKIKAKQIKQQVKQQPMIDGDVSEEQQVKGVKIKLPLGLLEGIQRTMATIVRYGQCYRSSLWRKQRYLKWDIWVVLQAYDQLLRGLFQKYAGGRFKNGKPKKLIGLLTLDELRNLVMQAQLRKTREAMKEVDQAYLDAKRLQIQDGSLQFGLNFQEFQQCLCRLADFMWMNPPAASGADLWQNQSVRKNTPLFLRFQALLVALYWKNSELHNKRMTLLCTKGIFQVQIALLTEKIASRSNLQGSISLARKNSMLGQQQISLEQITNQLRVQYDKMYIPRESRQNKTNHEYI